MKRFLGVLLILTIALTACSDDDGESADDTAAPAGSVSTTSTIPVLSAEDIDRTKSPYCNTWADIRSQGGPRTSGMDEQAATERRKTYYGTLLPLVERLLSEADDEIRPAVEAALTATRESATTGAAEAFDTAAARESGAQLRQYALDNCAKA